MYILPATYKCNRCGYECEYSPHQHHYAPTVAVNADSLVACPRCWLEWLRQNIGEMESKKAPENIE
jgi:DNA-directed RNA polymerase subunit RPC12/RpoP